MLELSDDRRVVISYIYLFHIVKYIKQFWLLFALAPGVRADHNRKLVGPDGPGLPKGTRHMGSESSNAAVRNINEYGTSLRNTVQSPHRKASDEFGSLTFNEESSERSATSVV